MAKQPTAWRHGATARFQNNPLKRREFEQLCVELQTEYRAKTRSELELIKNLATEFMRVGRTIDMIEEGLSLSQVALRGGWVSEETVFRYAQSWTQRRSAT